MFFHNSDKNLSWQILGFWGGFGRKKFENSLTKLAIHLNKENFTPPYKPPALSLNNYCPLLRHTGKNPLKQIKEKLLTGGGLGQPLLE